MDEKRKKRQSIKKIRIVFLAYYPASRLEGHIDTTQIQFEHPASWVVNLAKALSEREDLELHVVSESPNVRRDQDVHLDGVFYHFVKSPRTFNLSTLYYFNVKRLVKKVRSIKPDIVHAHGCEGAVGLAGIYSGYPCLISIQGVLSRIVAAKRANHLPISIREIILLNIERWILRRGRYFGTRTDFATNHVRSVNPKAQIFYSPEIMSKIFFGIRPNLDGNNILYVGSIIPAKGVDTLLEAFSKVHALGIPCSLDIVGSGDSHYVGTLQQFVADHGLSSSVRFHGYQGRETIANLMSASTIFILPSLMENSPNVLCEAMCAGLPVIATDVGGIGSFIQSGVTGLLIPPKDPVKLSEAMISLLSDKNLRENLSANARAKALSRHRPENVVPIMMDIYRNILEATSKK